MKAFVVIYMTGLSYGGSAVASTAANYPGRFAAVVPVSGGLPPEDRIHPQHPGNWWCFYNGKMPSGGPDGTNSFLRLVLLSLRTGTCLAKCGILLGLYLGVAIAVGAVGMGFHSPRDVDWMIETWLPRYLWLSMSIPVALCLAWRADVSPDNGSATRQE